MKRDPIHPQKPGWLVASLFMGLSLVRYFDRNKGELEAAATYTVEELRSIQSVLDSPEADDRLPSLAKPRRNGAKGITRRGARTVRCAAYLLQKTYGRGRLTFATVTLPGMPMHQLRRVHEEWPKVVEMYRLGLRRRLQEEGLRGEVVSVSEVQPQRHKKTKIPVLHLHSIFVGRLPYGGWALSTEHHDEIWRRAVLSVVPEALCRFRSAANLQEVHTSASAYLGKYMTKGGAEIAAAVDNGFAEWLPRQWWNCTRSLLEWVKAETVEGTEPSQVLLDAARSNDKGVWEFYGEVGIDIGWSQHYWLASYGRLSGKVAQELREVLGWKEQRKSERRGLAFVT